MRKEMEKGKVYFNFRVVRSDIWYDWKTTRTFPSIPIHL